jgi:DNA-binding response OmpR family regulator
MSKRILVVEDTEDLARVLAMRLKSSGYEIDVAFDAIQAVERAMNSPHDLIILDLGLPGGDGLDVLKRLRASVNTAHLPIVVFTARGKSYVNKALDLGATACLTKPCPSAALLATIRDALTGKPLRLTDDDLLG